MENEKLETEKIVLFEIYKKDGKLSCDFPNKQDTQQFELYGFLKMYMEILEEQLLAEFEEI